VGGTSVADDGRVLGVMPTGRDATVVASARPRSRPRSTYWLLSTELFNRLAGLVVVRLGDTGAGVVIGTDSSGAGVAVTNVCGGVAFVAVVAAAAAAAGGSVVVIVVAGDNSDDDATELCHDCWLFSVAEGGNRGNGRLGGKRRSGSGDVGGERLRVAGGGVASVVVGA
jgi:hypothetical protein